jgi:hypothetical protein
MAMVSGSSDAGIELGLGSICAMVVYRGGIL